MGLVIPYRNREEHLKKFIPHISTFLQNKINYQIILVEQADELPFNRAKLLNIGFELLKDECDYYCFHDIDMLPASDECDYSFINGVCKLSYYVSQFSFIPRPDDELGGVTLIDKESFIKVNGYCNLYYGWGVEDNDFALRCKIKNIPFYTRKGKYFSLYHKPNGDTHGDNPSEYTLKNRILFSNFSKNLEHFFDDGINKIKYDILEKKQYDKFIHIKVKL